MAPIRIHRRHRHRSDHVSGQGRSAAGAGQLVVIPRDRQEVHVRNVQIPTRQGKPLRMIPIHQCKIIYDIMRSQQKEDGTYLLAPFVHVPKIRDDPEYYKIIKHPMDSNTIRRKIFHDVYSSLDEMENDVELMVKNALTYYRDPVIQEFRDAMEVWTLFLEKRGLLFGIDSSDVRFVKARRLGDLLEQVIQANDVLENLLEQIRDDNGLEDLNDQEPAPEVERDEDEDQGEHENEGNGNSDAEDEHGDDTDEVEEEEED